MCTRTHQTLRQDDAEDLYGCANSIYTYLEMLFMFPVVSVLGIISERNATWSLVSVKENRSTGGAGCK